MDYGSYRGIKLMWVSTRRSDPSTVYVPVGCGCPPVSLTHRHRIDKYLDTLLANQPISDGEATDHCQKVVPQDGGLPQLIVARSCLTNHSEAASL